MDPVEKKVYTFSDEVGDATMTAYSVFPGVQVVYNSVHMDCFDLGSATKGTLIEIQHCREGRIEQAFEDELFYLTPGDLSVAIRSQSVDRYDFPLCHYHGLTIAIDADVAPQCFSQFLEGVQVRPLEMARRLCQGRHSFIARARDYVAHIFSELYSIPEAMKAGYLRVKLLELLMVLDGVEPGESKAPQAALSRVQVALAKQVAGYLAQRLDTHVTIAELSRRFGASDTHLKQAFKGVYGVPIYSYLRILKMQSAAQMLIHGERSVAEIASEVGYVNQSKFSAAFRDVMGESPSEYRKAHAKGRPSFLE